MDYNDKEKRRADTIVSLEEVRKKKEQEEHEKKEMQNSNEVMDKMVDVLFSNMDVSLKDQLKDMLSSYGMKLGDEEKEEVEKLLESEQLKVMVKEFDFASISGFQDSDENLEKTKKLSRKYEAYRSMLQWRRVYKPYTLDKFLNYDELKKICQELGLEVEKKYTSNEIIELLNPKLPVLIDRQIRYYDHSRMNHIANMVYYEGVYHLPRRLSDEQDRQMDYFESKHLIFRVKDSGVKCLVMPKEILDAIYRMDFTKYDMITEINTVIIKLIIGIANSYGVYPFKKAISSIFDYLQQEYRDYWKSFEQFEEHMKQLIKYSFGNMFLLKSYYPGVNVSSDYIYHGTVGFAEQFREIQKEYPYDYRELDFQQLLKRGDSLYYEDSIHLSRAFELLKEENAFTQDDEQNIKNLIYVFSKLEFKPSTVLIFLESMYRLPQNPDYEKLIASLEKINETTEKWLLKGHYVKEKTEYNSDTSKIINIDFCRGKHRSDDEE